MSDILSVSSVEDDKEFPKIPIENNGTLDQSTSDEEILKDFNIHEIFTNLNYPSCPEKLEKINLDKLLNDKIDLDSKDVNEENNDNDLEINFNIITSHSFSAYSVSSGLNKIKFLKNLKEENSKLESTYTVNTHSSENVQKSDILVTEDLDSLIKGVKSMPVIPKLQQMVPLHFNQPHRRDDNIVNKKKKRNKRKRKSERDRHLDDTGDRSPKSRKINSQNKNWDDITIEESEYFDYEDKENSFESILSQYNSMKQLPQDILHISQILNEPSTSTNNKDTATSDNNSNNSINNNGNEDNINKRNINKDNDNHSKKENKNNDDNNISTNTATPVANENDTNSSSLLTNNKENDLNKRLINKSDSFTSLNTENSELLSSENEQNKIVEKDNFSIKFKEQQIKTDMKINEEISDPWNKNSPISSTSSNASNMSDEESNYNTCLQQKKYKLEALRYSSILTPPTPPQPLEDN